MEGLFKRGSSNNGSGSSSSGASLYNTKLMAQAIADKGWACISKKTALTKAKNPTMYNNIVDKYNNAETFLVWQNKKSWGPYNALSNPVYTNGYYYFFEGKILKKTTDWITITNINDFGNTAYGSLIFAYNDKIVFGISGLGLYLLDTKTDTFVVNNTLGNWGYLGRYRVVDDKLIGGLENGQNWYISLSDVENNDLSNITIVNDELARFKLGDIFYFMRQGALQKGDNVLTPTETVSGISSLSNFVFINENEVILFTQNTIYKIDNSGTITRIADNTLPGQNTSDKRVGNCAYYKGKIYIKTDGQDMFVSDDDGATWTALTVGAETRLYDFTVIKDGEEIFSYYSEGGIYFGAENRKVYTDNYVIDDTTVTISYYLHKETQIKIVIDDTNLDTVYAYLRYLPYFYLNTTNETVTLPRNSNLWTYMYVGDNYQDDNLPTGKQSFLVSAPEEIVETSITPTLNLKANKNYKLTSTITSLTLSSADISPFETNIYFTTGVSISFTDNANIKWRDGEIPTLQTDTVYIISVCNGYGVCAAFGEAE